MKHAQTAAPLMSLIIKTVYADFGIDYDSKIREGSMGEAKRICRFLAYDLISGHRSQDMARLLHISKPTWVKYYDEIINERRHSKRLNDQVNRIRLEILSKAILEFKYSAFLTREAKRTSNTIIINQ